MYKEESGLSDLNINIGVAVSSSLIRNYKPVKCSCKVQNAQIIELIN